MKRIKPNYFTAVHALVGGGISGTSVDGSISEYVFSDGQTPPTESAIQTELSRQLAEDDALDYARKREAEYPSVQDLVVALYDTDDKAAIDAKRAEIKLKYPKP